jgi:hypothetical protein
MIDFKQLLREEKRKMREQHTSAASAQFSGFTASAPPPLPQHEIEPDAVKPVRFPPFVLEKRRPMDLSSFKVPRTNTIYYIPDFVSINRLSASMELGTLCTKGTRTCTHTTTAVIENSRSIVPITPKQYTRLCIL